MRDRLISFCINITDGEHGTVKNDPKGACFLLANENIIDGYITLTGSDRKISRSTFDLINKRCRIEKNDVLISTVGTIGKVAMILDDTPNYVFQRSVGIIKPNPSLLDSYYLKYLLMSPHIQKKLMNIAKGAVQKCIFIDDLKNIEVNIPDINVQKRVIEFLKCIDEKIHLNSLLIERLMSLGEEVFSRWFLQYEFPLANGKPFKDSGGEMIDNNILKTKIPLGWKVLNIKDICNIIWGQCPEGKNILPLDSKESGAVLYCSGAGDMRSGLVVDCQAKTNASRREAKRGDILMSVAGSIGALCICDRDISLGRAAVAFRPTEESLAFCYFVIKKYINRMLIISSGSIQKVVNDSNLDDINFAFDHEIVANFSFVNKYINKSMELVLENRELIKTRDKFLPLIINGQIIAE